MSPSLPWQLIIDLTSKFLDPKSLAMASCVSKSWNSAASADNTWNSLCLSHYPSSLHLLTNHKAGASRQLFALLYSSSLHRRRFGRSKPRISFRNLVFTVDVFRSDGTPLISLAKSGEELVERGGNGHVLFDVDFEKGATVEMEVGEKVRVTWMVVMKGWEGAFSVMEREGKGRLVEGDGVWFSEELPAGPRHCRFLGSCGLVAEFGLRLCRDDLGSRRSVGRVSLGMMSVAEWRYVSLEDGLLYLQQFLLPNS